MTARLDAAAIGFNASNNTTYTWGDWRIMDLSFSGGRFVATGGLGLNSNSGGYVGLLLLRLDLAAFETGLGFGPDGLNNNNNQAGHSHVADQLAVVDCTVVGDKNTSYSGYNAGNRLAFVGNLFDNGGNYLRYDENDTLLGNGSHALRFPFLNKAVISNNDIFRPGGDRLNIKLHAPFRDSLGNPDSVRNVGSNYSAEVEGDGFTKYVNISDHDLLHGGGGDAQNVRFMVVGPQDTVEDERGHDIIVERNLEVGHLYTQQLNIVHWPEVTIRNNLALANGAPGYSYFLQLSREGGEPPASNIFVYNNTFYKPNSGSAGSDGYTFVDLPDPSISNVTIKNNLGYAPLATGSVMYNDAGM